MTSFGTQSRASNPRRGSDPSSAELDTPPGSVVEPSSQAAGPEPGLARERAGSRGGYERWGKRALSSLLLLVALPSGILVGIPIATVNLLLFRDPRRILFRQIRIGYQGREFAIWKFRTMRDETPEGEFQSWRQGTDTSRVTRFGRFLRSTHLDELPQLINILAGDMDFIGPRPEMRRVHRWASELIPRFGERTRIRPGITGLAQVTQGYVGCDEQAYRVKLASDLEYGRRLSLRLDLQILLRTVTWMLMGRGWNQIEVDGADLVLTPSGTAPEGTPKDRMGACAPPRTLDPEVTPQAPLPSPSLARSTPVVAPASSPIRAASSTTPALGTPSAPAD